MNKSAHVYRWLLLTALVFLEVVACKPASPVFLDSGPLVPARVVKVADGDTIKVRLDGAEYLITYLGIDAPETRGQQPRPGRGRSPLRRPRHCGVSNHFTLQNIKHLGTRLGF